MRNKFVSIIFLGMAMMTGVLAVSCQTNKDTALSTYVDPRIGASHVRWFYFTPAAVPFGMAKAAPSTDAHLGSYGGCTPNGYDYRHTSIEGFANFHEFQVGGVVLAPTVGKLQTVPGALNDPESGYRSRFDKEDEVAQPGYYSVLLKDYGIKAELTAMKRTAFHRYTFPQSDQSHLIFDIGNHQGESGEVVDAFVTYTDDGRIEGYVATNPSYVNTYQKGATVSMYFSAELSKKPKSWGSFVKDKISGGSTTAKGPGAGLYLTFDTRENEKIETRIGLSYTSVENARLNRTSEAKNVKFAQAHEEAVATWEDYLSRITVEGGEYNDRVKFYTGLYHALLGRGLASDVNGAYPMNNGKVGQIPLDANGKPLHNHYNTDAIWGGYWNLTQLWTVAYPEYMSDWVQSQLLVYQDSGWLADGIACSRYVSGVGTNLVSLVIAAAYNCGIRDFDIEKAYAAAYKNEVAWKDRPKGAGKLDVGAFVEKGYSPMQQGGDPLTGSQNGSSHTLEYSFSSYAVAQMAKTLGKDTDYQQLMELSKGWQNLFDHDTKFIRSRMPNGEFIDNFNPYNAGDGFQEGNAVQYTYYVPHDAETLIGFVGKEAFNNRLDSTFVLSREKVFGGGTNIAAFAGIGAVYNHGNQPCLHIPWLFNFSGKPYLSQKWVRTICDEFYGTEGIHGYGYGQDEDQGQLGAWYVISSMGLFDVRGLTSPDPSFQIGSPLFDKVTIKLNKEYYSGDQFVIETRNNSKENNYIQSMKLNGQEQSTIQLPFSEVVKGGKLSLELSDTPNTAITQ